jgi:hypothetical protein
MEVDGQKVKKKSKSEVLNQTKEAGLSEQPCRAQ